MSKNNVTQSINNKHTEDNSNQIRQSISAKHRFEANHNYFVISIYALSVIILSALAIYLIWHFNIISGHISNFLSIASDFIIAFFIAYFINPIVKLIYKYLFVKIIKIKNERIGKILSILLAYLLIISIIVVLMIYVVPQVIISISDFTVKLSDSVPTIYNKIHQWFTVFENRFPLFDWESIESQIKNAMPQFIKITTDFVTYLLSKVINISISFISAIISLLISIVVSTYMIMDRHLMVKNACRVAYAIFPKDKTISICNTVRDCNKIFYNFVIGKALDSLIIGIISFIAMSIFRLEYALLISLIIGITNMIPYFGPFIGAIPGAIMLLIVNPLHCFIFIVLIIIIQQFDGLYLGPKILGDSVGLKPLWIIFGITIGGAYGGIFGMFIGVPLIAIVAYLINKFITARLIKKNITLSDFNKLGIKRDS